MIRALPLLFLIGCDAYVDSGPCPPTFTARGSECVFDEAAVPELMRNFDDGRLVKVNRQPFEQITENTLRNVWINRIEVIPGLDTVELYGSIDPYASDTPLSEPFPVGTVIVHERIDLAEGHTIQVRREDGYTNAGGGPWWFGKFYEDGTPDEVPCSPCEMCHNTQQAEGSEGLWGVPPDVFAPRD